MNKVLGYLPIAICVWYVLALLMLLFRLDFYKDIYLTADTIESYCCFVVLIHGLFNWNSYTDFAKSSCVTIVALALINIVQPYFNNQTYFYFYINILAANFIYGIIKSRE